MKNLFFILLFLLTIQLNAQKSPFNDLAISDSSTQNYSFLVSGHFHGSSSNISGFPAASLLSNIDLINTSGASFMVSTGDLFLDVAKDIPQYKRSLFDRLQLPLFNVVGNHDLRANVYQENYGATSFTFDHGTEKFIFLDTEKDDGNLEDEQWEMFSQALASAQENPSVKNIFIFSHRPVWSENNKKLEDLFEGNTRSSGHNNFETQVLPELKKSSKTKKIFWISGSLGGNAPSSFFYYVDEHNITYMQTGIRNLQRDGMIKVMVNHGNISFQTISFTMQQMPKLEDCGIEMWKHHPAENPYFWNLVPLYIKQMVFHRYFWYGIGYSLLLYFLIYLVKKRRKHKKID